MGKSKLLEELRTVLRYRHQSPHTEKNYIHLSGSNKYFYEKFKYAI